MLYLDNYLKRHLLRKSGKARKCPTQILLIFTHITYVTVNSRMLNFFGSKLHGSGVWAWQNSYLEEKKYSSFTKMDFWGQIWAKGNACNVFVKYRKYDLRGHSKSMFAWNFQFLTLLRPLFVPVHFTCTPPPSMYVDFSELPPCQKKFHNAYDTYFK